jgi:non-canonical poly(A) RNA polymerase PAPD5/7
MKNGKNGSDNLLNKKRRNVDEVEETKNGFKIEYSKEDAEKQDQLEKSTKRNKSKKESSDNSEIDFEKIIKELNDEYQTNIVSIDSGKEKKKLFSQDFIKIPELSQQIEQDEVKTGNELYPWLTRATKKAKGMVKLHHEILDFYNFIRPNSEEDEIRTKSLKLVKSMIKEKYPHWKIKSFGSFPNKIHLPDSDVDIAVIADLTNDSNEDQVKVLKKITKILTETNSVDYIQLIHARVPIIKATLKDTKINIDICANRKNGYEAKKIIKQTLTDFAFMRPIIYVLKYFLRQRKLNETYTGGISSFLLFNLLLAYIQHVVKEDKTKKITLGHLLVGFLQFYAFDFNFEDVGISLRHGGFFFKKSDKVWYTYL